MSSVIPKILVTVIGIAALLWGIVDHGIFRIIMGAFFLLWGWWL